MVCRLDVFIHLLDLPIFTDNESSPINTVILPAHELLSAPNTVFFAYSMIFVGKQSERYPVFALNLICDLGESGLTPRIITPACS